VIAVDTNVLVYAHRREPPEHDVARELIGSLARAAEPWAIPWPCVYEFFSVVTNHRIWRDAASTSGEAWSQVDAWLGARNLRLIGETEEFAPLLGGLAQRPRVRGPVIHDARVAAICVAHGVEKLVTRDRDFSLFPELALENPFA
jgi:toxin-antitoxin system PIN domain toxin